MKNPKPKIKKLTFIHLCQNGKVLHQKVQADPQDRRERSIYTGIKYDGYAGNFCLENVDDNEFFRWRDVVCNELIRYGYSFDNEPPLDAEEERTGGTSARSAF
jgi:hypothetical protein